MAHEVFPKLQRRVREGSPAASLGAFGLERARSGVFRKGHVSSEAALRVFASSPVVVVMQWHRPSKQLRCSLPHHSVGQ